MTQLKEKPVTGGNRLQGDDETSVMSQYSKALEAATEALLEDSKADDFNAKAYYKSLPTFAYLFESRLQTPAAFSTRRNRRRNPPGLYGWNP
ncbi:hypothetical protein HED54_15930 [Ochrobactrum anthropi ATCC 49188]|nr:hypothetical protein [Brucella anthropi ATCC 49188]